MNTDSDGNNSKPTQCLNGASKDAIRYMHLLRESWEQMQHPTDKITKLARSLAPVVVNNSRERFFMTDMLKYYFHTKEGSDMDGMGKIGRVLYNDKTDGKRHDAYMEYADKIEPEVPIYYMVTRNGNDLDDVCILYFLFYAFNGPKRVLGLVHVEQHTADIETIALRVRLDGSETRLTGFNMTCHGAFVSYRLDNRSGSNTMLPKELVGHDGAPVVSLDARGRPIVYAAINSHALFNEPGTYLNFMGFGNDTVDKGETTQCVIDAHSDLSLNQYRANLHKQFMCWKGRLGTNSVAWTDWIGRMGTEGVDGVAWRMNPDAKKMEKRRTRIPNLVGWIAYLAYAIIPIAAYIGCQRYTQLRCSSCVLVAFAAFVGQFYVLKAGLTLIFNILRSPTVARDSWDRWLIPFRLD